MWLTIVSECEQSRLGLVDEFKGEEAAEQLLGSHESTGRSPELMEPNYSHYYP
jgi:hypothetical protein